MLQAAKTKEGFRTVAGIAVRELLMMFCGKGVPIYQESNGVSTAGLIRGQSSALQYKTDSIKIHILTVKESTEDRKNMKEKKYLFWAAFRYWQVQVMNRLECFFH